MRTPEEILTETWLEIGDPIKMDQEKRAWITIAKKAIITAQTEAWNEALEAAIRHLEKVTTRGDILYIVSKLKK